MKNGLFAIINIGTSAFRMELGSFVKGEYRQLEYLVKSLSLGKDTFSLGVISSKSMKEAYDILSKFKAKMDEYKIGNKFSIVATSGVREAKNREFFMDYIAKKMGMKVNILTPHEELYIRYIGIKNEFDNFGRFEKQGIALVTVSSGNVAIAIVKNKTILYADSLHFGSLRLNEIFRYVDEKDRAYAYVRYIESMLDNVKNVIYQAKIKNIVFSGSSINVLRNIFSPKTNYLPKEDILSLFEKIKKKDAAHIEKVLSIRSNEAEILKPMLTIYVDILKLFESDVFYFSKTTFPRKLLMYYSKSYKINNLKDYIEKAVLNIGKKYNFDANHALCVRKNAMKLFDTLRNIHLLDNKYREILSIAALLHDVGYFVNENQHEEHSYYIIKSMHLPQISEQDNKIIALIALLHNEKNKDSYVKLYNYLSEEDEFTLMKLVSLLRIADALDASHRQLIKEFDVSADTSEVVIRVKSDNFLFFEEVSIKRKSQLFSNIFGIKIRLEHLVE